MIEKRILVVDDDPGVLKVLCRVISRAGYQVTHTNNPQIALDYIKKKRFAVVITDYCMPQVSGVELLREAHRFQPLACKLILSGAADIEAVLECMNDGVAQRFLRKPWKNAMLVKEIRCAVNHYKTSSFLASGSTIDIQGGVSFFPVLNVHTIEFQRLWNQISTESWDRTMLISIKVNQQLSEQSPQVNVSDIVCKALASSSFQKTQWPTLIEIGEYEFAVIISDISDRSDAKQAAERLAEQFSSSFFFNQGFSTMLGYTLLEGAQASFIRALLNAESAWKSYVDAQSNHPYEYKFKADTQICESILRELEKAVLNQELYLVFQPKISVRTGCIIGVECLLRWNNLKLGEISPSVFIPLAEENGLINGLGQWAIDEALIF